VKEFTDKDYEAVLWWLIEGLFMYLDSPIQNVGDCCKSIQDTTYEYILNNDPIGSLISKKCEVGKDFFISAADFHKELKNFMLADLELKDYYRPKRVRIIMAQKKFPHLDQFKRDGVNRPCYTGIRLKPEPKREIGLDEVTRHTINVIDHLNIDQNVGVSLKNIVSNVRLINEYIREEQIMMALKVQSVEGVIDVSFDKRTFETIVKVNRESINQGNILNYNQLEK
jgi:hypothetical protein